MLPWCLSHLIMTMSIFFPKKTQGENILTFIKEDLKEARFKLKGDYGNNRENKGRITQAAADALLADICLWNFEYEEALTYLNNIVNSRKYFLQPSIRWFELFNPGNSLEGILEFQFNTTLGQTNVLYNRTWVQNRYVASEFALSILDPLLSKEKHKGKRFCFTRGNKIQGLEILRRPGRPDKRTSGFGERRRQLYRLQVCRHSTYESRGTLPTGEVRRSAGNNQYYPGAGAYANHKCRVFCRGIRNGHPS
jgi:hypothetical protein